MYVALLGVLKAGASFVPIDPAAPADRIGYIADDAQLDLLIAAADLRPVTVGVGCEVMTPEEIGDDLAAGNRVRPALGPCGDETCYVLYTSGSTGRPKGVEVTQASICNFISVVGDIYRVRETDRVYQGMTIAFDFSIEEIWPTWAAGATLVAGPTGGDRIGAGLAAFLERQRITVLYCVPTVLATVERDLPGIRALLVGGEACPAELVQRWSVPGRRMLNTYGPTEATVTATWCELHPGRPVTIGHALPTYRIAILDHGLRAVSAGDVGEICIGGPGVARGYVNRPDLTAERFLDDPRVTGGGRLYRTGDLGRVLPDGQIEYLGRADSEVKIRGHRIDLQEIESILLQDSAVAGAAVAPHPAAPTEDLVAYLALVGDEDGDQETVVGRLHESLQRSLTSYMIPRFVEILPGLPLMASGKVDRGSLPPPSGRRLRSHAGTAIAAAETHTERAIAAVWSGLLGIAPVELSVAADFFTDLGGHSLLAARTVSELRESGVAPDASVAHIYAHPTIRRLAALIDTQERSPEPQRVAPADPIPVRTARVYACGAAQLVVIAAVMLLLVAPAVTVLGMSGGALSAGTAWAEVAVIPLSYFLGRFVLPVVGVRLLCPSVRQGEYPLWGADYLRFWTIRFLMSLAPLATMSGSPLLPWYLRLLGARVGGGCQLATPNVGLPSLLQIGDRVSVGYGAHVQTFQVRDNRLLIGAVLLGDDAFVGANAVVEPGVEIAVGAGLAEMSVATGGMRIPDGEYWSGSPAQAQAAVDPLVARMRTVPVAPMARSVRWGYVAAWLFVELLPLMLMAPVVILVGWAYLAGGAVGGWLACVAAGPLFVATACAGIAAVKWVVLRRTEPGIYPAASSFAVRKWLVDKLLQTSLAATNSLYATLYTPFWLRILGARIGARSEVSTISNLDPDLLTIGDESFVADMASMGAATHCGGQVALGPTVVGRRSFIGNAAFLRSGTSIGDECLIGVHSTAPAEIVSSGSEWLGSPPIHLPQRQDSGTFADELTFHPTRMRVLERLVIEYFRTVLPATLLTAAGFGMTLAELRITRDGGLSLLLTLPIALAGALSVLAAVVALKWIVVGRYRPRVEPLWSRFVRRTEFVTALYEAAAVPAALGILTGTPLLGPALRLFGTRVGRHCWIDTTYLTEFDLVQLGDECNIGSATSLQTHLFEDRVMKMSRLDIGPGASVGSRSVILYDSVIGAGGAVDAMSLIMKGEHVPARTAWQGIPARVARGERSVAAAEPVATARPVSGESRLSRGCGTR